MGANPHPSEIELQSVEFEYRRWEARLTWPGFEPGLSAGTWSSSGPGERSYGVVLTARTAERFREMARALDLAADRIDAKGSDG